jgi:hypothetical protein
VTARAGVTLLGNLDCEARWAGVALPAAVLGRVSLYASLFAACAPDDGPHDLWLPAPIDPARLIAHPGWTPPIPHTGAAPGSPPGGYDLAWADPAARDANDRSRTLAIAEALGVALPGARVVGSLAELDDHLAGDSAGHLAGGHLAGKRTGDSAGHLAGDSAGHPTAAAPAPAWVCKARWTAAGRDRAHGTGRIIDGELRRRLARMFTRLGPLVFEPWLDRVADLGVCGEIRPDGTIQIAAPHALRTDPRGGFLGIELLPAKPGAEPGVGPIAEPMAEPIAEPMINTLQATAHAAAIQLAATTGYRGPFAIDAFVYRVPGATPGDTSTHRLHPLCELNARHTFGWIARGLARRLGIHRLGFDPPPPGATLLIAPGDDRVTAWCA